MAIKVEMAVGEDIPLLVEVATDMHAESNRYRPFAIKISKVEDLLLQLVDHPSGCVLVARDGDEIVGMFWGLISEFFFSNVRVSQDLLLYVLPSYRNGTTAVRLIKYYEQWAIESGAGEIQLAVSADIDNARAIRLYQGLGYEGVGLVMKKDPTDV